MHPPQDDKRRAEASLHHGPPRVRRWALAALVLWAAVLWPRRDHAQPEATFELVRALPDAQVWVVRDGRDQPCPWSAADRRFVCGPDYWAFVGEYAAQSAGQSRHCVWVHPTGPRTPTVLYWPNVALGAQVQLEAGLVDGAPHGAAVEVQVQVQVQEQVQEQVRARAQVQSDDGPRGDTQTSPTGSRDVQTVRLQTSDSRELAAARTGLPAGPARGAVRIEVRASDHSLRMACIGLQMTGQRPAMARGAGPARSPSAEAR